MFDITLNGRLHRCKYFFTAGRISWHCNKDEYGQHGTWTCWQNVCLWRVTSSDIWPSCHSCYRWRKQRKGHGPADTASDCEERYHQAHGPADTASNCEERYHPASNCEESIRHMALLTQCLLVKRNNIRHMAQLTHCLWKEIWSGTWPRWHSACLWISWQ